MKLRLLTPLLLVLSSTLPTAHADAGEKFSNFDHLIPLIQEAGMDPEKAIIRDTLPLGADYYAILIVSELAMPSEPPDQEGQRKRTFPEDAVLVAILDDDSNQLQLCLGKCPLSRFARFDHGDEHHLVCLDEIEFGEDNRWVVYFDLDEPRLLETREYGRFGVDFIAITDAKLIAANAEPKGIIELPRGKFPLLPDDVTYYTLKPENTYETLNRVFYDAASCPVFASDSFEYHRIVAGWISHPIIPIPRLWQLNREDLWKTFTSPEFCRHPEALQVLQNPDDPGVYLLNSGSELLEVCESGVVAHALPQPTASARFMVNRLTLKNEIGPMLFDSGRLVFGVSFQNTEDQDGVGGLGSFDPETGDMGVRYYPALVEHSVSTMAMDAKDRLWLGLVDYGYENSLGAGLLRFDPKTEQFTHFEVGPYVRTIHPEGDLLYVGTDDGLMVLRGKDLAVIETHPALGEEWAVEVSTQKVQSVPAG